MSRQSPFLYPALLAFSLIGTLSYHANAVVVSRFAQQVSSRVQASNSRPVYTKQQTGANVGARIVAAEASLGSNPGTIYVQGGGTINQVITFAANHKVVWDRNTYTFTLPPGGDINTFMMILHDGVVFEGNGTTFVEPLGSVRIVATYGMTQNDHTYPSTSVTRNIKITGIRFQGNPNQVPRQIASGARSVVSLGNCHKCSFQNNEMIAPSDLGVTAGSTGLPSLQLATGCSISGTTLTCPSGPFSSAMGSLHEGIAVSGAGAAGKELQTFIDAYISGSQVTLAKPAAVQSSSATVYLSQHAEDVVIMNNRFENFASQVASSVNGWRVDISNNTFINGGKYSVTSSCAVDFEPNTEFDVISGSISGNEFDFRGSVDETGKPYISAGGICVQNPALRKNYGPVDVSNNRLRGGDYNRAEAQRMTFAVFLLGATNTTVRGNSIIGTGQPCIYMITNSNHNTIERNTCINAGGGGNFSIQIKDSSYNTFRDNQVSWHPSGPPVNADLIVEQGTSDYNTFEGNVSRGAPTLARGRSSRSRILSHSDNARSVP